MKIKLKDIKWAYNVSEPTPLAELLVTSISRYVIETIRTDEIATVMWLGSPVATIKITAVNNTPQRGNFACSYSYPGISWEAMLKGLKITGNDKPLIGINRFELFCYRPKKQWHPKQYPTYTQARQAAARRVSAIFTFGAGDRTSFVSIGEVSEQTSDAYCRELKKADQSAVERGMKEFHSAIDGWISRYTDEMSQKRFEQQTRYPLAPEPLKNVLLRVFGIDDDGNFIYYEVDERESGDKERKD